jgi:hypothetical protein
MYLICVECQMRWMYTFTCVRTLAVCAECALAAGGAHDCASEFTQLRLALGHGRVEGDLGGLVPVRQVLALSRSSKKRPWLNGMELMA